jgi:hypothetical protein
MMIRRCSIIAHVLLVYFAERNAQIAKVCCILHYMCTAADKVSDAVRMYEPDARRNLFVPTKDRVVPSILYHTRDYHQPRVVLTA